MYEGSGGPGGAACLSAQLVFRPLLRHEPYEADLAGSRPGADVHRWVIAAPLCGVAGSVVFTPATGDGSRAGVREVDFRGRGYHDHRYGTAPPGATLRRWAGGHVHFGNVTYAFHVARPLERGLPDAVRLIRCDAEAVGAVDKEPLRVVWRAGQGLQPPYPAELTAGERLRLVRPRVIDAEGCRLRLLYHASAHGGGETGTGWCEVGHPQRGPSIVHRWGAKLK
jgi:hypothetical protein